VRIGPGWSIQADVRRGLRGGGGTEASVGTEVWISRALALRAGYLSRPDAPAAGRDAFRAAGVGAGLGLKLSRYQVDYALTPDRVAGDSQRISLSVDF
jgi:hypothetical protein